MDDLLIPKHIAIALDRLIDNIVVEVRLTARAKRAKPTESEIADRTTARKNALAAIVDLLCPFPPSTRPTDPK